ncbi:MAG: MG2 domain-containing protein, partial [Patescibacteria group bacterium]
MDEQKLLPSPSWQERLPEKLRQWMPKRIMVPGGILAGIIVLATVWWMWQSSTFTRPEFEEFYTLVPDKVSQSAAIPVRLPEGVRFGTAEAAAAISFDPELKGSWHAGTSEDQLFFQPDTKLALGSYYAVTLASAEIILSKDFLVDEDPRVISVFPNKDSEASEYSSITIVFNRPMVPLTTLDELSGKEIPIEISPDTSGKFTWITTRNLQFIPKDRLARSSHYTVAVKSGLVSMDGLSVPEASFQFTTRPLRYEYMDPNAVLMQGNPLRLVFNQPVDIERTQREFVLRDTDGNAVDFVIGYGKREIYNADLKEYEPFLDKSIVEIYNARDRHGRKNLWDFETRYSFTLAKAYPIEGDMVLEQPFGGTVSIPPIISNISAESLRSSHVSQDLFDPEGKLWIGFAEDINKDASRIEAKAMKEIGYGEKCREPEPGEEISYGQDCQKVPEHKSLYLTFDSSLLQPGEEFTLLFKKIVNTDGLVLNTDGIAKPVRVYPPLTIHAVMPGDGTAGTDLTKMIICSSNPLSVPDETTFYERVKSNVTVGLWNWYEPQRVTAGYHQAPCAVGQFENTIHYGLIPEFPYEISLSLVDDFGQKAEKNIHFQSGKLASLDRNFFHLQKEYNVTSPDRLKLAYGVDNLEYVNLHICEVTPETMLRYLEERPEAQVPPADLACSSVVEQRINLPKKYWSRTHFQIDLKEYLSDPVGHYVLSFGHPEYRRVQWEWSDKQGRSVARPLEHIYERTFISVTQLAVQEKKVEWREDFLGDGPSEQKKTVQEALRRSPRNLYWVTRFGSLDPVPYARVELYKKGAELVSAFATGNDGIARSAAEPDLAGVIVRSGNDSAIISEHADKLSWNTPVQAAEYTYVYTDKPIYRPGQQVFIKGIYRLGFDAEYKPMAGKNIEVLIRNSKYEEISKKTITLNDYGTFTTDILLDTNAPLGTYSIEVPGGSGFFDVEEYVPAAFQVEVTGDREEYVALDTMNLDVDARYYFGVPVEGGEVEYSIASQDFYFDRYEDGYFSFGRGWYYNFDGWYGDTFILRGKTALDTHGKARISQELDFSKFFKGADADRSKIFTVHITVRNRNGQSIAARKSFIVHRGELYAGVSADKNFAGKNEQILARIKTVDTNGKEISHRNVSVEVQKITWESFKRREVDGQYYYRSEEKRETVRSESVSTDRSGTAQYQFSLPEEGEYEIHVSAQDSRGNTVSSSQNLYIYGEGSVSVRPTNNETLDLATDKQDVSVGERVTIIIKSPYERARALVSIERGTIFSYHLLDVQGSLTEFVFDVKEEYIPNVSVSVLLLSPQPEIKFGEIHYRINTKERELEITTRSDKNHYLPGETVNLDVEVADKHGRPAEAEISLAVVDMSVLALKGNPKKNPVLFFFAGSPVSVSTASNIKNILHEADIPAGTKGGGGGSDELARKKRGVFKDTALWEGVVQTDGAGRAHVSFRLPDNLTTWQVESVGVTKDTKVGAGYLEFTARKELMAVPLQPRFIVPGDTFFIGSHVFNETEARQKVSVSLTSSTLHVPDDAQQSVTLNAHESKTLYFAVEAPRAMQDGRHSFTVSANGAGVEDTVEDTIPITRNETYESVATAHYTGDEQSREYI